MESNRIVRRKMIASFKIVVVLRICEWVREWKVECWRNLAGLFVSIEKKNFLWKKWRR
jgi:hypothetical protein